MSSEMVVVNRPAPPTLVGHSNTAPERCYARHTLKRRICKQICRGQRDESQFEAIVWLTRSIVAGVQRGNSIIESHLLFALHIALK